MTWCLIIPDDPIPLKRARSCRGRFYDSQYDVKQRIALYAKYHVTPILDGPIENTIELGIKFFFSMPKSWSKKKREKLNKAYHTQKPDLTNCIKMVEDTLNGIFWKDDSQIAKIYAQKFWSDTGYTEIMFYDK
jgi:Holliday junction resolvase RusA-like endonuclease